MHASTIAFRVAVASTFAAALGVSAVVCAHGTELHHTSVRADAVKWGPAPPFLPPGAQAAVLLGNPAEAGAFVIRLKFPAGYIVPPHRHTNDELVTVMSGKLAVSVGERVDRATLDALPAGSFVHLPGGMPHYAVADGEAVVQINGNGPFDITYVDPKDDPRDARSASLR